MSWENPQVDLWREPNLSAQAPIKRRVMIWACFAGTEWNKPVNYSLSEKIY